MEENVLSHRPLKIDYSISPLRLTATTGIGRLDRFIGGFSSGRCYILEGYMPMINHMTSLLAVNIVKRFEKSIVLLDGGNAIDIYGIADISRINHIDANYVLTRLMLSRAFTAYQLDSLVNNIDTYCADFQPALLIVNGITDLLFDRDIKNAEAEELLENWIATITAQTQRHDTITLVTSRYQNTCFADFIGPFMDGIIRFKRHRKCIKISMPMRGSSMMYKPVSIYQLTIDDFSEVD
jgi:hypothetical protein